MLRIFNSLRSLNKLANKLWKQTSRYFKNNLLCYLYLVKYLSTKLHMTRFFLSTAYQLYLSLQSRPLYCCFFRLRNIFLADNSFKNCLSFHLFSFKRWQFTNVMKTRKLIFFLGICTYTIWAHFLSSSEGFTMLFIGLQTFSLI